MTAPVVIFLFSLSLYAVGSLFNQATYGGFLLAGGKDAGYIIERNRDKFARLESSDGFFGARCLVRSEGNDFAEKVVVNVQQERFLKYYVSRDAVGSPCIVPRTLIS
jgi:hypothetical protein